jgi:hypothetical protein
MTRVVGRHLRHHMYPLGASPTPGLDCFAIVRLASYALDLRDRGGRCMAGHGGRRTPSTRAGMTPLHTTPANEAVTQCR